jgi:hypothetical protein
LPDDTEPNDGDWHHQNDHRQRDMFQRFQDCTPQGRACIEMTEGEPVEKDHGRKQQQCADQPDLPQPAYEPARHGISAHHAVRSLRI